MGFKAGVDASPHSPGIEPRIKPQGIQCIS